MITTVLPGSIRPTLSAAPAQSSPAREQQLRDIQACVQARLASGVVANRLHRANFAAFEQGTARLVWPIGKYRLPAVLAIFKIMHESRRKGEFDITAAYRPVTNHGSPMPRAWFAVNPKGAALIVNRGSLSGGSYKTVVECELISFKGSSFHPFERFTISPLVQVRPLNSSTLPTVLSSIQTHKELWDEMERSGPSGVHLPKPPDALSIEEGIFVQSFYRVLDDNLSQLSPCDLLTILIHVGDTLTWMHSTGRVHGDVKPNNVLLEPNPNSAQNPSTQFIGLLNDFDLTCSKWGREYPFSIESIRTSSQRFEFCYCSPCAILNIPTPLNDLCNFAQMVCEMFGSFTPEESQRQREIIFRNVLMSKGGNKPLPDLEVPSLPPLDRLKCYFQNAFRELTYKNAFLFLRLIGAQRAETAKQIIGERLKSHFRFTDQELITEVFRQLLPTIPLTSVDDRAVRTALAKVDTFYILQNMVGKLRRTLEKFRSNEQRLSGLSDE